MQHLHLGLLFFKNSCPFYRFKVNIFKLKIEKMSSKNIFLPCIICLFVLDLYSNLKTVNGSFGKNTSYLYILNADHIYEALCKVPKVDSY